MLKTKDTELIQYFLYCCKKLSTFVPVSRLVNILILIFYSVLRILVFNFNPVLYSNRSVVSSLVEARSLHCSNALFPCPQCPLQAW